MERNILKVYIQTYTRPKKENLKHDTVVNTFFSVYKSFELRKYTKIKKPFFLFLSFVTMSRKPSIRKHYKT